MKRKEKDFDDVLYWSRKNYVKYDRSKIRKFSGTHIGFSKNLTGCWDDPGSTRDGWRFFYAWFDSNIGRPGVEVRRKFARCKRWSNPYWVNQKWDRFVNDTFTIDTIDRASYYLDNDRILRKYED